MTSSDNNRPGEVERCARWLESQAGPGALIGDDVTKFVLGLAVRMRAALTQQESRNAE